MKLTALKTRTAAGAALAAALAIGLTPSAQAEDAPAVDAQAVDAQASDPIGIYPPIQGPSTWDRFGLTHPSEHHRVFSNWGHLNDWSVDIYQNPGATVVSPFGTKTSAGHPVSVQVVTVQPGCKSGDLADGGWRVGLEAKNDATGEIVGRADVMHVDNKPDAISVGASVGPWDALGTTGRFRSNDCYQVNGDSGAHIHLEVINQTRYACYINRGANTELTDETAVGRVGTENSGPTQAC